MWSLRVYHALLWYMAYIRGLDKKFIKSDSTRFYCQCYDCPFIKRNDYVFFRYKLFASFYQVLTNLLSLASQIPLFSYYFRVSPFGFPSFTSFAYLYEYLKKTQSFLFNKIQHYCIKLHLALFVIPMQPVQGSNPVFFDYRKARTNRRRI